MAETRRRLCSFFFPRRRSTIGPQLDGGVPVFFSYLFLSTSAAPRKIPHQAKKKQQVFLFKQNGRTETEKRKRDSDLSTPNMTGTLMGCTEFFCCCCFFFWSFSCSVRGRFLIRPSSANRNWPSFSVVATFFSFLSFFFV